MKPDEVHEVRQPDESKPDGHDPTQDARPGLIQNVLRAATGQAGQRSPEETALEEAEKRAEASAKEAIRASQAALAAQQTARRAADEAAAEAKKASQAALAAQAALKDAQAAKVALAARRAADRAAGRAAEDAAREAAREAAQAAAARAAEMAAEQGAAREAAQRAAEQAALLAAERAAREDAERAAQEAARQAADQAAKQAARQAAREAAARAARAARAAKLARRAAEKEGTPPAPRPKRVNLKVAIGVPVTAAALLIGVVVTHGVQIDRTATVMLRRAEEAQANGDEEDAIRFYTHYVNYQPQDHEAYSKLALMMADRARRARSNPNVQQRALAVLEKASRQDPENLEVLRRLADVCMNLRLTNQAANHLGRLREQFPGDSVLGVKLAQCQIELEKNREAIATLEQVTAEDRHNLDAYITLADLLHDRLDDADRAELVVNQMVAQNPRSVKALVARARFWHRGDELTAANEDIKQALEMAPNSAAVLVTAAEFALDSKAFDDAAEYLDKAEALHPDDEDVERARTVLNLSLGKTDVVLDRLQKQMENLESGDAMDLLTVADLQLKKGDLKAVRETMKRMREAGFREEITEYFEARIQVAEGRWREATYLLERLRPQVSNWPEFLVQIDLFLGACFEQLRLPDRQLATYRSLLDRDPELEPARAGYAAALFRVGKYDEAARQYDRLEKSMGEEFLKTPALRNNLFQLIIARTMQRPEGYRDWTALEEFIGRLSKIDGVDEVQLTLMRAELLSKKGDLAAAREAVDSQLDKYGKDVGLWNASIKLASLTEGPEAGLRVARQARGACGDAVTLRLTEADLAAQVGPDKAAPVLETLAADTEALPEAEKVRLWRGLGAAWYRLRDRDRARELWMKVVDSPLRDPQIFLVLFELAREAGNSRQMAEAVQSVERYLGRRSSEAAYCEASHLVWQAQRGEIDVKELIRAKQMLAEAAQQRPNWHEIPRLEAEIAMVEGKTDEAISLLQRASELGPLSPVYMGQLVQLLFSRGRYEEARDVINDLGRTQVSLTMKRIEAELSFRMGDFEQALALAEEAVKDSDQAPDFLWYGELLARNGKFEESLRQFRKAVELDPRIPQGWIGLVAVLVQSEKVEEAERVVRQAQASLPEDQVPLVMAQCYQILGEPGRAEQYYLTALAQAPEDFAVMRRVARFYMLTGRSDEAKRYIGQILRLAGRDPEKNESELVEARRWMARVLAAEGDWRQLQQAVALLDRNTQGGELPLEDLRLKAAMLAARPDQGSQQKAIELYEQIRDERKKDLTSAEQFQLAKLYHQAKRWTTAREELRDLIQKYPKEPRYLATYVDMMFEHDSPASAIDYSLGKLEELVPDAAYTRVLRARLLVEQQKPDEAVETVQSLIPRPLSADAVRLLPQVAATLEELEQVEPARQVLVEYSQKTPAGHLALGAFLGRHGTIEEALDEVEKALAHAPAGAVLSTVIGILAEQRKKGPIAAEHFQRVEPWFVQAAEEAPGSKSIQLQTAALRDVQENYADQIRIYREFLARNDALDREKAIVWNNLAFLLAVGSPDQADEALKLIDQAIAIRGPEAELLDTRAVALLAAGRPKEAVDDLRAAIADSPSAIMYFHLAKAHSADGDQRAAARALQVARENYQLTPDDVPKIERDEYLKLASTLRTP